MGDGERAGIDTSGGEHPVVALERAALAQWCCGDPTGFLEVIDAAVGYFDPFLPVRLDGAAALTAYYEGLRGRIAAERWEMLDPRVEEIGDAAVLSFRFHSEGAGGPMSWNATEVWRRRDEGWRLCHTHWSFTAAG